jgi:4-amino-4-deoxy-L-arabinose transferase-like glycosyltransferase
MAARSAYSTPLLLAPIVAIAAGLRLAHLGDVPGNPFYDAAVHTMSLSWHSFLFGALDPSGGVAVDKPPVDLWVQVGAVKLFGYNPTALKLPQALAGAASVIVLFDLVRPRRRPGRSRGSRRAARGRPHGAQRHDGHVHGLPRAARGLVRGAGD